MMTTIARRMEPTQTMAFLLTSCALRFRSAKVSFFLGNLDMWDQPSFSSIGEYHSSILPHSVQEEKYIRGILIKIQCEDPHFQFG